MKTLKRIVAGAVMAGALGAAALGVGTATAQADRHWDPIPPPGHISHLPFVPPPGHIAHLPFVPPPGHWDKPWKWLP